MPTSPGTGSDESAAAVSAGGPPERRGRLSRNIYVVSLVSFFQDTASELLYPVLPFFVTGVLGAPPAVLGLIEGLADGTASAMKALSGRLADLRRRRPLVAAGYSASAFGKLLLAIAGAWPMVLAARVTDRIGKGLRGPPRDAIIADDTTPANRGRAFGFHRAADTAGAVVGPLLGLGLYELVGQEFGPLLWIAILPAALSAGFVFLIRERPHLRPRTEAPWSVRGLPRRYWRLIGVVALFGIVNFPDTLLLLRAKDLGLGFAGVVAVYVLYNLTYALLSYPAGVVSDRRSRRVVFAVGLVVFSATYLGFGLTTTPAWLWLLLPLYGAYTALTDGVSRAWVSDLVPEQERGTALGIHAAVSGGGLLVAGVWAGLAWHGTGHVPFIASGILVAVLAVVLLAGGRIFDQPAGEADVGARSG
jgi:MFS family permease